MKPSLALSVVLLAPSLLPAADLPWLAEVTTPPADVPEPDRPLSDLLRDASGQVIESRAAWEARRAELRKAWLDFLGPLPQGPAEMKLEVVLEERLERCTRSVVRYEAEPGRVVEACLLRPTGGGTGKRPVVVVFHPTTTDTIGVVAGTAGKPEQHIGLRLAERGFVALCPRNFLWETAKYDDAVAAAKQRHPESRGMATMLADAMRAVDVLASLPDVDSDRIGAIGHSLGAKEVLYLMAFDDRVKAGVASEGGVGLSSTNWDAPWYLGPECREPHFPRDHHELLALAAPRPLLVLGGESGPGAADGDRTWPYVAAAQKVYRLYGEPVRLGLLNHRQGHRLSPDVAEKAFAWLEVALVEGR
jgi:dienelactone hydrolase